MKVNIISFLKDLFSSNVKNKYSDSEIAGHIDDLVQGYEEYLNMPDQYHDEVIKRMYRKTKFKDEDPETLRDILHFQITGKKR